MSDTTGHLDAATAADLRVMLARLDERMGMFHLLGEAREKAADLRHAETKAAFALYVPRAEIEADNRARDERIKGLEAFRSQVYRVVLPIGGLVIGGLAFLGKLGVHLREP